MTSHVVVPESTRYDLTTGGWILVKARLNAGEYRRMMSSMMGQLHVTPGQTALTDMPIDPMQAGVTIVVAHLLDWTQTDPNGAPMLIRDQVTGERISSERLTSMLDSLSIPVYTEIETIIQAHYDRARQAEKKTTSSGPSSPKTSPSPDAAGGAMSGSPSSMLSPMTSSSSS